MQSTVFDLSPEEKLQLVEDLWDDLASRPADVPLHSWQIEELERRQHDLRQHPESALSWQQIKERLHYRHEQ
jgi:putative addiction module component (TIGR02574 family)